MLLALTAALIAPFAPVPSTPPAPTATAACAEPAKTKVRVMLMDLRTAPSFSGVKQSLGAVVAEEAAHVDGYAVLSASDVRAVLDQQANKSLAGCDDTGCLAELASALDAELVVDGSVFETQDNAALVSLSLVNAKAIVVINRVTMTWAGAPKDLPDVVRAAADTLMLDAKARPAGSISLAGVPLGATVSVDGVEHNGESTIEKLAIGPHDVKVELSGKLPFVAHAIVKSGKTTSVTVALEDAPPSSLWVWLGAGGAIALGGAVALGVAYALGPSDVSVHAAVPRYSANDVESLRKP